MFGMDLDEMHVFNYDITMCVNLLLYDKSNILKLYLYIFALHYTVYQFFNLLFIKKKSVCAQFVTPEALKIA